MSRPLDSTTPIALYDTKQKLCFGIFATPILAQKYLMGKPGGRIIQALGYKSRIRRNLLGTPVAVRHANDEQISTLGSFYFWLHPDYQDYELVSKVIMHLGKENKNFYDTNNCSNRIYNSKQREDSGN